MAKVGFWMRGFKGKVGGMSFSKGKNGDTIASVYENSTNPRTARQMTQRAKFADVVKFFKHANQAFFKFAFEDRKTQESDYNAFVRHNIRKAAIFNYEQASNEFFPAIGDNWMLTMGTLSQPTVNVEGAFGALTLPSLTGEETNWGQISAALIRDYSLRTGDFVTLVVVSTPTQSAYDEPVIAPAWDLHQYTVDPNATMLAGDYFYAEQGKLHFGGEANPDDAMGVAVVFSRQTASGLKVSTSYLMNNPVAQAIYDATLNDDYRLEALDSWKVSGEAILQGAISENTVQPSPYVASLQGLVEDTDDFDTAVKTRAGGALALSGQTSTTYYVLILGTNLPSLTAADFDVPQNVGLNVEQSTDTRCVISLNFQAAGTFTVTSDRIQSGSLFRATVGEPAVVTITSVNGTDVTSEPLAVNINYNDREDYNYVLETSDGSTPQSSAITFSNPNFSEIMQGSSIQFDCDVYENPSVSSVFYNGVKFMEVTLE